MGWRPDEKPKKKGDDDEEDDEGFIRFESQVSLPWLANLQSLAAFMPDDDFEEGRTPVESLPKFMNYDFWKCRP